MRLKHLRDIQDPSGYGQAEALIKWKRILAQTGWRRHGIGRSILGVWLTTYLSAITPRLDYSFLTIAQLFFHKRFSVWLEKFFVNSYTLFVSYIYPAIGIEGCFDELVDERRIDGLFYWWR